MDYKIKETLKKEFIEQDIKRQLRTLIITYAISIPVLLVSLYLGIYAIQKNGFHISTLFFLIFACIITIVFTRKFIIEIDAYIHCKNKYIIVLDRLVNMGWETKYRTRNRRLRADSYFYFYFAVQGKIQIIHTKTYYPWSVHYSMIGSSVINSSSFGEDFYLVLVNKKIVSVYNKKMFELSDELLLSPNRKQ